MLQAEQFAEIGLALEAGRAGWRHLLGHQLVEPLFFELHLKLFVETVGDFVLDARNLSGLGGDVVFFCHRGPQFRPSRTRLMQQQYDTLA